MADTKVSALTADATPSSDDLLYTVNDPGGTPASRKVTIANLAANMPAMTVAGVTSTSSDSFGNGALTVDSVTGDCAATGDFDMSSGGAFYSGNNAGVGFYLKSGTAFRGLGSSTYLDLASESATPNAYIRLGSGLSTRITLTSALTTINHAAKIAGALELGHITNYTGPMGNSTLSPTTDAPADWVEIKIGGTTYYIPAYAAS